MLYPEAQTISKLIKDSKCILIIQPDNPDGDSLASSLALEQILGDIGKQTYLYCGMQIPSYLRYLEGWDRVTDEIPAKFDMSIIVDTATDTLLGILSKSAQKQWVKTKPVVVLDHHLTAPSINYAQVICTHPAVATGELIYELAVGLKWPLNLVASNMIATSILSDSLGLMSDATTSRSVHIIGELMDRGVNLAQLDNARRDMMRKSPEMLQYKGDLLQRVEYLANSRLALVIIPWEEIERYSPEYNPSMLVIDEMRLVKNVAIAICLKIYKSDLITAKIRCNYGYPIAAELAEQYGGGGHAYASGFKIEELTDPAKLKGRLDKTASDLLNGLEVKND